MKYRRKVNIVEAIQFNPTAKGLAPKDLLEFVGDSFLGLDQRGFSDDVRFFLRIKHPSGVQHAAPGDWIIKAEGGLQVCTPEFFAGSFDEDDDAKV